MARFPTIAAFVFGGIVGGTLGVGMSANKFAHQGQLAEFRMLQQNLAKEAPMQPQLREFMKCRLYYLAMGLAPHEVAGHKVDYGPVDAAILAQADPRGEPVALEQLYQDVLARHVRKSPP